MTPGLGLPGARAFQPAQPPDVQALQVRGRSDLLPERIKATLASTLSDINHLGSFQADTGCQKIGWATAARRFKG